MYSGCFAIIVVSIVLMIIPVTAVNQEIFPPGTANASSDTYYFITIDPIGNHSVSDVFFVNGTTNLPVGDTLLVEGSSYDVVPGRRWGSDISVTVSVLPGYDGVNIWSCNLSPILWNTWGSGLTRPTHDIKYFYSGDSFFVRIWANRSPNDINELSNRFTISSVESGVLPAVSQTSIAPVTTTAPVSPGLTTVNAPPLSPTPSVPLSGILPVLAITTMAVVWSIYLRRQV